MCQVERIAVCFVVLLLVAFEAAAQEQPTSRPVVFPAATADAMLRLRDGKGSIGDVRAVFAAESGAGRVEAATWWIDTFEAASGGAKIAGPAKLAVAELRREAAKRRVVAPEIREFLAKYVARIHALVNRKNFDGARRAYAAAVALQVLVEDPATARVLATHKERLEKAEAGDADAVDLERSSAAFAVTEDAAVAAFTAATQDLIEQFSTSGCSLGRQRLMAAFESAEKGGLLSAETMLARTAELRVAARRVERTKRVAILARSPGMVRYWLDGFQVKPLGVDRDVHNGNDADRVDFDLIAGDVLHAAFDTPYTDAKSPIYVAALHATLDGTLVPTTSWRRNIAGDPTLKKPKYAVAPVTKKRAKVDDDFKDWPPEVRASYLPYEFVLDAHIGNGLTRLVAFDEELVLFEKAFADRQLPPLWVGVACEKFVMTFVMPK